MSEWAMKRFWEAVSVEEESSGFEIRLDGRAVKTPAKRALRVPTRGMGERIASEWQAQEKVVDPLSMPWTRSANAAIDKVAVQRDEVVNHLAGYAASDLLCYRAEAPDALVARQAQAWNPLLDWASATFGAKLAVTAGVMPVTQNPDDLERLTARMRGMSAFQLTGFHDLVTISGSFVLALASVENVSTPDQLWALSRLDEDWQIEQWGEDEEAKEHAVIKQDAFFHANEFYHAA